VTDAQFGITVFMSGNQGGNQGIRTAIRTVAFPVPVRLRRWRAQPTVLTIFRLVLTSVLAYQLAVWQPVPVSPQPLLAPLTALLVLQVTLYQTFRYAWQRVASVMAGVLVAVLLSHSLGFSWWSLGLAITAALIAGYVLRLGDSILEVPISAMLILALDTADVAAAERVTETIIGTITGLAAGFIHSPVRVEPAEAAIEELGATMGNLLEDIAAGMEVEPSQDVIGDWLARSRALDQEIHRVDNALEHAEESVRLNPRGVGLQHTVVVMHERLEALEHCSITIRGLARALADHVGEIGREFDESLAERETDERLAAAIRQLARAIRTYGRMSRQEIATGSTDLEDTLEQQLASLREDRADLADRLRTDTAHWQLHGELLVHLDRLRDELQLGQRTRPAGRQSPRRPRIPKPSTSAALTRLRERIIRALGRPDDSY
jgi:uncharacterized membrane protein YgaE (UPF0421/DUF939 family)